MQFSCSGYVNEPQQLAKCIKREMVKEKCLMSLDWSLFHEKKKKFTMQIHAPKFLAYHFNGNK